MKHILNFPVYIALLCLGLPLLGLSKIFVNIGYFFGWVYLMILGCLLGKSEVFKEDV